MQNYDLNLQRITIYFNIIIFATHLKDFSQYFYIE